MDIEVKECIGCGFCCIKTKCAAGARLYPGAEKCPALKWNGKRHVCDLMQLPCGLGEIYRKELYAGEGCCANLNSWRYEPLQDRTQSVVASTNPIPSIMQTFLAALGKQWISGDMLQLTVSQFVAMLESDGMSIDDAKYAANKCIDYINSQKSTFAKEFIG